MIISRAEAILGSVVLSCIFLKSFTEDTGHCHLMDSVKQILRNAQGVTVIVNNLDITSFSS